MTADRAFDVAEGGSYTLTTNDLSASDVDANDGAAQLTWRVSTAPTSGTLQVGGTMVSEFTQAQLAAGAVIYVHNGNEPVAENFTLQVEDDGTPPLTADSQTITITVTDTNDAPTNSMATDGAFGVAEGGMYTLSVDDFSAGDEDADDNASNLTWTVITASTSGELQVGGAMVSAFTQQQLVDGDVVYVHGGDEPAPDSFVIQVADDDNAMAATQTITITVTPVNDAPVLSDTIFVVSSSATTGTVVGTVMATDVDNTAGMLSYSIATGGTAPAGLFAINEMSGEITIANGTLLGAVGVLDTLNIAVSDGVGGTGEATITVQVGGAMFATSIAEGATVDTAVTVTFDGSLMSPMIVDEDGSVSTTVAVVMVARTGDSTISVSGDIDFEALGGVLPISVMVTAADDVSFTQILNLTVTDVAPIISGQFFEIPETASDVGTIVATGDMSSLNFAITSGNGTGEGVFAIDASGVITVADSAQLDFEGDIQNFLLNVEADDGTATSSATVQISVTDVAPIITMGQSFEISETASDVGTVVTSGDMSPLMFEITAGNTAMFLRSIKALASSRLPIATS